MSDEPMREETWGLLYPFWIDTDGYSERDRLLFSCGVEYQMILEQFERGVEIRRLLHRENESRVRMLCGKFKRRCSITPHDGYDGCEMWSDLVIEGKP